MNTALRVLFRGILILAVVVALVLLALSVAHYRGWEWSMPIRSWLTPANDTTQAPAREVIRVVEEQDQVVRVVAEAAPAVVSIVAKAEVPRFETYYEDLFDGLFGIPFNIPRRVPNGTEEVRIGAGTGFFVSADGYIVTNRHVVAQQDATYVVYRNDAAHRGEKVEARVIALDPNTDLAILKVDVEEDVPYLSFADSTRLNVGQTAITIGYALGEFDNTVSKGVISGLSRSIVAGGIGVRSERLTNLIQTDAAINPGNSGGPMLDLNGKVIGVNVAVAQAENIGFAIPASEAERAYREAREHGTIRVKTRAFLGVRYIMIDEQMAERNHLPVEYGALIVRGEDRTDLAVVPGSPADKAGLVENDIILRINDKKLTPRTPLSQVLGEFSPGDTVTMTVYHKGEEHTLSVRLEEYKPKKYDTR